MDFEKFKGIRTKNKIPTAFKGEELDPTLLNNQSTDQVSARHKRYTVYPGRNSNILDKDFCQGQNAQLLEDIYKWILKPGGFWPLKIMAMIIIPFMNKSHKKYIVAELAGKLDD